MDDPNGFARDCWMISPRMIASTSAPPGALARGAVVVVTAERGDRGLKTAQCHLATSLSEWLREEQVDGAGRPFGVCKNTDPVSRRHFTKAQIEGVHWAAAL